VTEISPPVEVIRVVRLVCAELERVIAPPARRFPVGTDVVAPVIERVVPAVNAPAPLYAPAREISMEVFAFTGLPRVTKPPVEVISTDPAEDVIAALVAVVI
jgi:hypothetical protein